MVAVSLLLALTVPQAQITVDILSGPPVGCGTIEGCAKGIQVGSVVLSRSDYTQGAIWRGNLTDVQALPLQGWLYMGVVKTDGTAIVGSGMAAHLSPPGNLDELTRHPSTAPLRAVYFASPSQPFTDLHPAGFYSSQATCLFGSLQAGYGRLEQSGPLHPLLWQGTAASAVDFLPPGFVGGKIYALGDGLQAGSAYRSGETSHPGIWTGTPDSFQDMTPSGFVGGAIKDVSGQQMVGFGVPEGQQPIPEGTEDYAGPLCGHALLWEGPAPDAVDLHPASAFSSFASGTDGYTQVGYYCVAPRNDLGRACLWHGSDATFVDLHAALPSRYLNSRATAVSGKTVYGWATGEGAPIPVVWHLP